MEEKHIIAIETGSSKIKGAVGVVDSYANVTVKAVEEIPLIDCVRHGQLVNVTSTSNAVRQILRKIENREAPRKVEGVYVAVGGRSVMSFQREVERRLMPETEITQSLIDQLKKETFDAGIPGREILAVIPKEYIVDNKTVHNPIGVYGTVIKMVSVVIACRSQIKRNLDLLVNEKLGLKINGYIVRQLAEASIVLTPEEKRLGCLLVDFGAETVTASIYKYGVLQYLVTLPIGSRNITRDITSLNYLEEDAETLKRQRGSAKPETSGAIEDVQFTEVNNYIRHRAAEIAYNIKEQLEPNDSIGYAGFNPSDLPAGIIIIGGGAKLADFNTKLAETMKMNVRFGSVLTPSVRIADGKISPSDSIDVIAILHRAAQEGAIECLSPKPVLEVNEPKPEPEYEPEPKPEPGKPKKPKKPGRFWTDLGKRIGKVTDYLVEPEEDNLFIDDEEDDDNF